MQLQATGPCEWRHNGGQALHIPFFYPSVSRVCCRIFLLQGRYFFLVHHTVESLLPLGLANYSLPTDVSIKVPSATGDWWRPLPCGRWQQWLSLILLHGRFLVAFASEEFLYFPARTTRHYKIHLWYSSKFSVLVLVLWGGILWTSIMYYFHHYLLVTLLVTAIQKSFWNNLSK